MDFKNRYLKKFITEDLSDRMVFIGGPRQVGKTTLAAAIGRERFARPLYLNWDNSKDQKTINRSEFSGKPDLVIFDELHKRRAWKTYVKGIYDKEKQRDGFRILVTGSARLDVYRRGGDSLFGRYHHYRLHPFSLGELIGAADAKEPFNELEFPRHPHARQHFDALWRFSGFPEPFLKQSTRVLKRWHNEYADRLIKDDIRDLTLVRDISALQILVQLIPDKIGSLFSLNALREDLEASHKAIASWVDIFERFYYLFRLYPYRSTVIRSLRKEPKAYLWDWTQAPNESAKLENMIASHLLKFVHFLYDTQGERAELFYLREAQGREVDFLVTVNRKPWFAAEVKQSDQEPSKHLSYFGERLKIPFLYQVVETPDVDFIALKKNVRVISADKFLSGLV